jgi:hypothetical protein
MTRESHGIVLIEVTRIVTLKAETTYGARPFDFKAIAVPVIAFCIYYPLSIIIDDNE